MANISTSSIFHKEDHDFNMIIHEKLFTLPFSEQDVLELQEIFVTLGVHTIKTKNIAQGRKIIKIILDSLNYYHNIGCVTQEKDTPITTCDILKHIVLEKIEKGDLLTNLEDFLAVHPCFDFIWIEFTENLKKEFSYKAVKNIFDMYHVEERMSVLIVTYDEE